MSKRPRILLTGDDGYNSIGTRLLIRALKDDFDLQIAGTKHQQTGVGGRLSLREGGEWGTDTVDGVPAFWVDGSPCDAMDSSQGMFPGKFDYLISGVNLGANASSAIISSGTYAAAVRGMGLNLAPRGIAISWDAPKEFWYIKHDANDDLSPYFSYPGDVLRSLVLRAIKEDFWGAPLLNINVPQYATKKVKFTKIQKDITRYYSFPIKVDPQTHRYAYEGDPFNIQEDNPRYDVAAIAQGFISISPCAFEMTHFKSFGKLEHETITL